LVFDLGLFVAEFSELAEGGVEGTFQAQAVEFDSGEGVVFGGEFGGEDFGGVVGGGGVFGELFVELGVIAVSLKDALLAVDDFGFDVGDSAEFPAELGDVGDEFLLEDSGGVEVEEEGVVEVEIVLFGFTGEDGGERSAECWVLSAEVGGKFVDLRNRKREAGGLVGGEVFCSRSRKRLELGGETVGCCVLGGGAFSFGCFGARGFFCVETIGEKFAVGQHGIPLEEKVKHEDMKHEDMKHEDMKHEDGKLKSWTKWVSVFFFPLSGGGF
jgi:hypothetical protein